MRGVLTPLASRLKRILSGALAADHGTSAAGRHHPLLATAADLVDAGRYKDALRALPDAAEARVIGDAYWFLATTAARRAEAWPQLLAVAKSGLRGGAPYQLMFASTALALRKMKRIRMLHRIHDHVIWRYQRKRIEVGPYINVMRALQCREPLTALQSTLQGGPMSHKIDFVDALVEISRFDMAADCLREWQMRASSLKDANRKALEYFEARKSKLGVRTADQLIERILADLVGSRSPAPAPGSAERPLKILMFASSLRFGGSERQLAYLLDGLDKRPDLYRVTVIVLFRSAKEVVFSRENIEITYRDELPDLPGDPVEEAGDRAFWEDLEFGFKRKKLIPIIRYARRFRPHVVHHAVGMTTDAILAGLSSGAGRIVIRFGGLGFQNSDDASDVQQFSRRIGELCLSWVQGHLLFVTNSKAARRAWSQHLAAPPELFTVIDNGTRFQALGSREDIARKKEELFGSRDVAVVGYVGRFHEVKRPKLWIRVAVALAEKNPNVRFLLVGDGGLRSLMERDLDRSPFRDRFVFTGQLSEGLSEMFQAMDVFLLTSQTESLPNVVIEALGYGVYVVAGQVGDVADLVQLERNGRVVTEDSCASFVEATTRALEEIVGISAMRSERAQQARARFGVERMRDSYRKMFEAETPGALPDCEAHWRRSLELRSDGGSASHQVVVIPTHRHSLIHPEESQC